MGDIAFFIGNEPPDVDIQILAGDVAPEEGLDTAVWLSIFTDARARDDDELPADPGQGFRDRRGWWGDSYPDVAGDVFGSRLWLLERSKATQQTLTRAVQYAREALVWLKQDGIAEDVAVSGKWVLTEPGQKILALEVEIHRPANPDVTFRFHYVWKAAGG